MLNQAKNRRQIDNNNNYYECDIIKASSLRPINNTVAENNKFIYESKCKLRLFSTFLKVIDCQTGIEEVFHLNRKSRIEWIWNNNEYKNSSSKFLGFILCLSLEPENKHEQELKNMRLNFKNVQNNAISNLINNQNISSQQQSQVRKFSLTSLNQEYNQNTASDIENEQNVKIQIICYFTDNEQKQYVIQYFKMRVIQRNFHRAYKAVRKLGKGSFASVNIQSIYSNKYFQMQNVKYQQG